MRLCNVCRRTVGWIDCPTGGWWAHVIHPEDGHDADVTEVVPIEQLHEFAFSISCEMDDRCGIDKNPGEWLEMARTLMTDLLERGWRPPVE